MMNQLRLLGKSLVSGREVDWESAYQADLPRIYNFFRYRVGDGQIAEDLTAETFEKAWRNRHRYRNDLAGFSTWLFTIARNVIFDYFRKARPEIQLDDLASLAGGDSVENIIQSHSEFERLFQLLAELPDRERELVALKFGADLTNREIAQLVKLSESNVGTILHRVTQGLRSAWEEETP